MGLPNRHCS